MLGLRTLAALLVLTALPLATQEPGPSGHQLRALEERARDELHPSEDPLVVVGREQAGNDLRARTPALARGKLVAAAIDPVAAYERALALYAEGATFHAPPATLDQPAGKPEKRRSRGTPQSAASQSVTAPSTADPSPWWRSSLPAFLTGVLVLLFFYRRHGRALRWRT